MSDPYALINAVKGDDLEEVKSLLNKLDEEEINITDNDNKTALCYAVNNRNFEIAKEILKRKVEIPIQVLESMFKNDDIEVYRLILQYIDEDYIYPGCYDDLTSSLFNAIINNSLKIIEDILRRHPEKVNEGSGAFGSPLMFAVSKDVSLEVGKILLSYGARFFDEYQDMEPVMFAVKSKKWMQFLIENGEDINTTSRDGETLLFNNPKFKLIKYAIKLGADVNHNSDSGRTPLHVYVDYSEKTCNLLLDSGAGESLRNEGNITPLHINIGWISLELLQRMLIEYGPEVTRCMNLTDEIDEQTVLQCLFSTYGTSRYEKDIKRKAFLLFVYGADFRSPNRHGVTLLSHIQTQQLAWVPYKDIKRHTEVLTEIVEEFLEPSLYLLSSKVIVKDNVDISILPAAFNILS